jgi:hypothetical protein
LSRAAIRVPQAGQRDGGLTTDSPRGNRWTQTFAKLPTTRPKRQAVISNAGVLNSSDQSGAGILDRAVWGPLEHESRHTGC